MSAECNTCYIASTDPEWMARIVASARVDQPCPKHAENSALTSDSRDGSISASPHHGADIDQPSDCPRRT